MRGVQDKEARVGKPATPLQRAATGTARLKRYHLMCFQVRLRCQNAWQILAPYFVRYFKKMCEWMFISYSFKSFLRKLFKFT